MKVTGPATLVVIGAVAAAVIYAFITATAYKMGLHLGITLTVGMVALGLAELIHICLRKEAPA